MKITLDGYQPYEKEINAVANEKSQLKIVLEKSNDPQSGQ